MRLKTFLLFPFIFLLAACASSNQSSATSTPNLPAITPTPTVTATAVQEVGCSVVAPEPTQAAAAIIPAVSASDYSIGTEDASVTLVEYCDFQAPICRSMAAVVSNVVHNHPNEVRVVFRPVPLIDGLDKSELAVQASIAAGDQNQFWPMYDALFQRSDEWDSLTPTAFESWLNQLAPALGLDAGQFAAALTSDETVNRMKSMYEAARTLGIIRLPVVMLNGEVQGSFALSYNSIDSAVSLLALSKRQFKTCPPFSIDPAKQYTAILHTEKGDAAIELFADKAPLAVNSFVFLARQGWFDNITFHRVIAGVVAQSGDPSGTGLGNAGYFFKNEINSTLKFDSPGIVAMANSGPDTNSAQFFITFMPEPQLDGSYTIFGRVLSGLDVLEKLTPREAEHSPSALPGDKLIDVEIQEK